MEKVKIVDLTVPIQPTTSESPLSVDIEYIDHKNGSEVFGPIFGLEDKDFSDGNFSAVEKLSLTTQSGIHIDAPRHYRPTSEGKLSRTMDETPLDGCQGLIFKKTGEEISDYVKALDEIQYISKPFDIVPVMTGPIKY